MPVRTKSTVSVVVLIVTATVSTSNDSGRDNCRHLRSFWKCSSVKVLDIRVKQLGGEREGGVKRRKGAGVVVRAREAEMRADGKERLSESRRWLLHIIMTIPFRGSESYNIKLESCLRPRHSAT